MKLLRRTTVNATRHDARVLKPWKRNWPSWLPPTKRTIRQKSWTSWRQRMVKSSIWSRRSTWINLLSNKTHSFSATTTKTTMNSVSTKSLTRTTHWVISTETLIPGRRRMMETKSEEGWTMSQHQRWLDTRQRLHSLTCSLEERRDTLQFRALLTWSLRVVSGGWSEDYYVEHCKKVDGRTVFNDKL